VAGIWQSLGAGVVEGDAMGRLVLQTDPGLIRILAGRFGDDIVDREGRVNRSLLSKRAFATDAGRKDLTCLTFPPLYQLARREMARLSPTHSVVVFDAALIFEWGVEKDFDRLVVVTAPRELILKRAAERLGKTVEEIADRLDGQIDADRKASLADHLIVNDGDLAGLEEQARQVWNLMRG
jgi:dephospho-CoA kinase